MRTCKFSSSATSIHSEWAQKSQPLHYSRVFKLTVTKQPSGQRREELTDDARYVLLLFYQFKDRWKNLNQAKKNISIYIT